MPLIKIDRLLKLAVVETMLAKVFHPAPSRPTIVGWIEEGTLEGRRVGRGDNWYVYTSSLDTLILESQSRSQRKLAA